MTRDAPARATLTTRQALVVIGLMLAAFGVRLLWYSTNLSAPRGDTLAYRDLALNLAHEGVFGLDGPTAERPPGWPALFALSLRLFGTDGWDPASLNLCLGAFSVVLVFALGFAVFPFRVALFAAALVAVYVNHVAVSATLASEPLFLDLWLLAALMGVIGIQRGTWPWFAAAGVMFGLAALVRPTPVFIVAVLAAVALIRRQWLGVGRGRWLVLVGACALTLVPWTMRNAVVLGHPVIVSTTVGENLFVGNNPSGLIYYVTVDHPSRAPLAGMTSLEAHREGTRLAVRQMIRHPFDTALRWPAKLYHLLQTELYFTDWCPFWPESAAAVYLAYIFGHWVWVATLLGLFAWLSLLWLRRGEIDLVPLPTAGQRWLLFLIAIWVVAHLLAWAQARFRHGIEPLIMLFAAAGWDALLRARRPAGAR